MLGTITERILYGLAGLVPGALIAGGLYFWADVTAWWIHALICGVCAILGAFGGESALAFLGNLLHWSW
ncbi:MAG: hypothetical protein SYC29_03670 [Planctomycetota bacterium]|nr:hypothetical protein [Planctomycetota bacterium]